MEGAVRVAVSGALGSMGRFTCAAVAGDPDLMLVAAIDPIYVSSADPFPDSCAHYSSVAAALQGSEVDVLVDFTQPQAVLANVLEALAHGVAPVVGTTGLSAADLARIEEESTRAGVPVFVAPNFALGAVLMMQFAREAARHLDACEIVELHHPRKLDAPSGTAKRTAALIEDAWTTRGREGRVPMHSVRLPGLVAHQEVIFGGWGETLTLRHDSLSRESFMPGVVLACRRVLELSELVYGLENLL